MPNNRVVLVTTTFYKSVDELRFQLAYDTVQKGVEAGHKVVVVDGSPNTNIAGELRSLGAKVFPQLHKGMGASRREAFFHAREIAITDDINFILWTEPEKNDIVRWIDKIIFRMIESDSVIDRVPPSIIVLKRSEKAWETWPAYQRKGEEKANAVYNEAFGVHGFDPMLGVVAFRTSMAHHFILCHPNGAMVADTYIQHYSPMIAKFRNKVKVSKEEIDIVYPPEQRAEEEGALNEEMLKKRKWQLETLSEAYKTLGKMLKPE